ncbi:urotensin 1 [Centropristis striata]|uniref:urotensin 1 n=1 Tax=Centropristis striata TaxID=184440 RepID=UPI0027E1EDD9|nr:urotensin 1 [Centropristis striata]
MKPVPLLLLLSSVLLSSHLRPAAGRPRILPGWLDGSGRLQTQQLDEVLLRAAAAGDSSASDLLGDHLLRFLQKRNPDPLHLLSPAGESEEQRHAEEEEEQAVRTAVQLLKRSEEPPLSIDLTFHLLRNMIQMAKMESQREQAQLNRKVLDEVGK